ncbi:MAG: cytochrome o ubiquinol oxidase subunit IV [Candidatus Saccharimonadales bacterium]
MSKNTRNSATNDEIDQSHITSYLSGFVLSILLTLVSYGLVVGKIIQGWNLVFALSALAIAQCMVQLVFFLHLGQGQKFGAKIGSFLFMLLVAAIVIVGSVWIMRDLNVRMIHSDEQQKTYMEDQQGI